MAKKRDFMADFGEITEMINKTKTINETMSFCDSYCDEDEELGVGYDCANGECDLNRMKMDDENKSDEQKAVESEGGAEAINLIREISLKGMIQLCSDPQNPVYQTLKKIFTFCDKAVTEENDENQGKK